MRGLINKIKDRIDHNVHLTPSLNFACMVGHGAFPQKTKRKEKEKKRKM